MTTSTILQQQTSAYHYGTLSKKSPSAFAGWQKRHCILAVDMFLYYLPPKADNLEAGPMKGFILLKDILDVKNDSDNNSISIVVKGREFLFKAVDKASCQKWMEKLRFAVAVINSQDPQVISEILIDKLWSTQLLGISLKDRRVVGINWDGAKAQGWRLGDVAIKVNDKHVVDQADAVEKLRQARSQPLPFKVVIMRYDAQNDPRFAGETSAPAGPLVEERGENDSGGQNDVADPDDATIDVTAGNEEM